MESHGRGNHPEWNWSVKINCIKMVKRLVDLQTLNGHLREPSFIVLIDGEELILDLYLNDVLFADGFLERTYSEDHSPVDTPPKRVHHCYYQGGVRGHNSSKVALSTCNGLSGVIFLNGESFYIEPLQESEQEHLIYRAENVLRDKPLYTFEGDVPPQYFQDGEERLQKLRESGGRQRRDVHSEMKYIELVLVADRAEFEKRQSSKSVVFERCKTIANIMDLNYQALNTRVALALVEVWSSSDEFVVSSNPSQTLGMFQNWRRKHLVDRISHDNAQFITGINFDGNTVGMAGVSTMCSLDDSCGVTQDHGDHPGDVASTICHEMGHNLGLGHDSETCKCDGPPRIGCIMTASSGSNPPTNWSSCSQEKYASNLESGLGACMFNYPKVIFDGPICQNGFIEEGEECDCGSPEDCDNPCCYAETCTLHVNATCAIGECCQDCQLKDAGNLCRGMVNECDLPEYCTGIHEECPPNVYRQNGVGCTQHHTDVASCYNGRCVSYDDQCKRIWGDDAKKSHDICWKYNEQGNGFGNCGTGPNNELVKCSKKNKYCGKLYCEGGANFPILGSLASAQRAVLQGHECKAASVDQGNDVPDPGYVVTGSLCDEGMICYNYACVNFTMANIVPCKYNCHDEGICNSNNNCHCNDAWNPPFCEYPGSGGSIDSGPANKDGSGNGKPRSNGLVMIFLLVILIPLFVIGVIIAIWKRDYIIEKAMKARSQFRKPDRAAKGRYAQVTKPASSGYIYRPKLLERPRKPPPPRPTATGASQPKKTFGGSGVSNGHQQHGWPDETNPPTRQVPSRPAANYNKPDNSDIQPSVSIVQPWNSQPLKPVNRPPPKPTPPSRPSPVTTQRAALKPAGPKPTIPKRPISSTGLHNSNWNNSTPPKDESAKPVRAAPPPPTKK
ncbi:zinc metalloproteinase-disintegrin-like MTP8 isoform X3 [Apostichopus japonicus]|uniref:zinc metalloproteinase-disintegrin-like MTP8 isoform X3 n=1 Tax=Stichopus japonicus TaxID=307972 RepID=UPI003AB7F430